jgi:hypothetical protein
LSILFSPHLGSGLTLLAALDKIGKKSIKPVELDAVKKLAKGAGI